MFSYSCSPYSVLLRIFTMKICTIVYFFGFVPEYIFSIKLPTLLRICTVKICTMVYLFKICALVHLLCNQGVRVCVRACVSIYNLLLRICTVEHLVYCWVSIYTLLLSICTMEHEWHDKEMWPEVVLIFCQFGFCKKVSFFCFFCYE